MMHRLRMACRLIRHADDARSRLSLARYLASNAIGRALGRVEVRRSELDFRFGGMHWRMQTGSSQLGGLHDIWTAHEYDAFEGFVATPGSVVVDVGANVGAYSLWQLRNMDRRGVVLAVEASPSTLAVLRRNVERNDAAATVTVLEAAVWNASGTIEFTVSERSSSTAGVTETLDMTLVRHASTVSVTALTLDDLLDQPCVRGRRIDVLKLDVEGAELTVLQAASSGALARISRIVVEADDRTWAPVRSHLEAAGFDCVGRNRMVGYFSARPIAAGQSPLERA